MRDLSPCGSRLDRSVGMFYGTGASYCLRQHRPRGPIDLEFKADNTALQLDVAVHAISKAVRASFSDVDEAVEYGAYGIALLLAATQMRIRYGDRSFKGTGFDFFVSPPDAPLPDDPDDIFAGHWGLEVSGLMEGDETAIATRQRKKRAQVSEAVKLLPVLVAIIEFSKPIAIFELLEHRR